MTADDAGSSTEQLSFASDIKPLFRKKDRDSMMKAFDLWSYDDVRSHADVIIEALKRGVMPCDGAWPADQVALLDSWQGAGFAP
ncbi:MAG TPA: hypothetical protein VHV75_10015 [Solirubrobacteraceae bacterium]|jgi:hypothetical protein|nr:hypothetical protein [Solirubrobacteraceae bacterium]